ncbi:MAG: hypothetical protein ACRESZ_06605 [Methylococcales bacterium]
MDEMIRLADRYRNQHPCWTTKRFYAWYRRDGGGLPEPGGRGDGIPNTSLWTGYRQSLPV